MLEPKLLRYLSARRQSDELRSGAPRRRKSFLCGIFQYGFCAIATTTTTTTSTTTTTEAATTTVEAAVAVVVVSHL